MRIDPHTHTSGISLCSKRTPAQLCADCRTDGLDAIVLTNHYKTVYRGAESLAWFLLRFVREYEDTRREGKAVGLRVFFGVEVTLDSDSKNDFLLYGVTPEALLSSPDLCALSLPALSDYAHAQNALLFHAHPYRYTTPADPKYLDGIEINCHPNHGHREEEAVRAFAKKHHLLVSCGSDYHGDSVKAHCGMEVPDTLKTAREFADYLTHETCPTLYITSHPIA